VRPNALGHSNGVLRARTIVIRHSWARRTCFNGAHFLWYACTRWPNTASPAGPAAFPRSHLPASCVAGPSVARHELHSALRPARLLRAGSARRGGTALRPLSGGGGGGGGGPAVVDEGRRVVRCAGRQRLARQAEPRLEHAQLVRVAAALLRPDAGAELVRRLCARAPHVRPALRRRGSRHGGGARQGWSAGPLSPRQVRYLCFRCRRRPRGTPPPPTSGPSPSRSPAPSSPVAAPHMTNALERSAVLGLLPTAGLLLARRASHDRQCPIQCPRPETACLARLAQGTLGRAAVRWWDKYL